MSGNAILRNASQVLKFLVTGRGFDRVLNNVEVISAASGQVSFELKIDESHLNRAGGLHGGFTSTLVDVTSTLAIMAADKPPGVSVDLHVTFLNPAHIGNTLVIDAECQKLGRSLAFASVDIREKEQGRLVAQGRHTKLFTGVPAPSTDSDLP